MNFLLTALLTLSSPSIEINEPLVVTLTMEEKVDVPLLRGELLSGGNFILREEKIEPPTYTWTLEALRAGTFPITLFHDTKQVVVKPFSPPERKPPPPLLPLTSAIPPDLSQANQALLAEWEKEQPQRNQALLRAKAFPWLHVLSTLALLFLFPLAYRVWKHYQAQKSLLTPEEWARKQLLEIQNKKYESRALIINDLSQTVRQFIQAKYGLSAPHQTTEEFLKKAAHHPLLSQEAGQKLALFLLAADQVKFANRVPEPHEIDSAIAYAKSFII